LRADILSASIPENLTGPRCASRHAGSGSGTGAARAPEGAFSSQPGSAIANRGLAAHAGARTRHAQGNPMAEKRYFGTDGIRGRVGQGPISADFVLKLGWAAGRALAGDGRPT